MYGICFVQLEMGCEFRDIVVLGQSKAAITVGIDGKQDLHAKDRLEGHIAGEREDLMKLVHLGGDNGLRYADSNEIINVNAKDDIERIGRCIAVYVNARFTLKRCKTKRPELLVWFKISSASSLFESI